MKKEYYELLSTAGTIGLFGSLMFVTYWIILFPINTYFTITHLRRTWKEAQESLKTWEEENPYAGIYHEGRTARQKEAAICYFNLICFLQRYGLMHLSGTRKSPEELFSDYLMIGKDLPPSYGHKYMNLFMRLMAENEVLIGINEKHQEMIS